MVHIFYTWNIKPFSQEKWDKYLSDLPDLFKNKILKLIRWEDRQNSLTGKLLLKYGLQTLYSPSKHIESIEISPFGKPFIPNSNAHFNISHSESCSVCVFNLSDIGFNNSPDIGDIGVDIEALKPVEFKDFFSVFTNEEKNLITNSTTPLRSFYEIWTRKESVVKAQGKGLSTPLNTFCVSKSSTLLNDGNVWNTYPININPNYICSIAVKEIYPQISIKYIEL